MLYSIERDGFTSVANSMFSQGALNIDFEKLYLLGSGVMSPLYVDAGALLGDPNSRSRLCCLFTFWINQFHPEIDAVVGIANGGVSYASAVAGSKMIPLLLGLPKAKDHGLHNQIIGEIPFDGAKVALIDDVITTGRSALSVVEALRNGKNGKKAEVVGVYSIFDWDFKSVNNKFAENGVKKHSLTTIKSLLDFGVEKKLISPSEAEKILKFYYKQN